MIGGKKCFTGYILIGYPSLRRDTRLSVRVEGFDLIGM